MRRLPQVVAKVGVDLSGVPVTLQHDTVRKGNSNVRAFVGNPGRLRAMGFELPVLDVDVLLSRILEDARQQYSEGCR